MEVGGPFRETFDVVKRAENAGSEVFEWQRESGQIGGNVG